MKNFILALMIVLTASSFSFANCSTGSCSRTPLRTAGNVVVRTTGAIVTAPFRVVNKAVANSKYRRSVRRSSNH